MNVTVAEAKKRKKAQRRVRQAVRKITRMDAVYYTWFEELADNLESGEWLIKNTHYN